MGKYFDGNGVKYHRQDFYEEERDLMHIYSYIADVADMAGIMRKVQLMLNCKSIH